MWILCSEVSDFMEHSAVAPPRAERTEQPVSSVRTPLARTQYRPVGKWTFCKYSRVTRRPSGCTTPLFWVQYFVARLPYYHTTRLPDYQNIRLTECQTIIHPGIRLSDYKAIRLSDYQQPGSFFLSWSRYPGNSWSDFRLFTGSL